MPNIEELRQRHRTQVATLAFRHVFCRAPNAQELADWLDRFTDNMSVPELLRKMREYNDAVAASRRAPTSQPTPSVAETDTRAEFDSSAIDDLLVLPNADFVEGIYQRFLGRAADKSGKKHHLARLQHGVKRAHVAKGIYQSEEAKGYRTMLVSSKQIDPILESGQMLSPQATMFLRRLGDTIR
ncbi:DUF4214 domain-containing protein [Rhabdochromatium marinum]|uniref:DUF4214 domain-containing protein n=1 Tax=Rhabdochromatium marinum TaxID=48729 RepID=UPI001905648D|nr:DUF4214 domain-containing protein [Rhabdochromatium marinum]MBK1648034.1 hypothetical protein [Rhabdochromatium marinum]